MPVLSSIMGRELALKKIMPALQAHSVDFVRRIIERQLDSMRKTRTTLSPDAAHKVRLQGLASMHLLSWHMTKFLSGTAFEAQMHETGHRAMLAVIAWVLAGS